MIIEYDRSSNIDSDRRIQSLRDNIQLALYEQDESRERLYRGLIQSLGVDISSVRLDFASVDERLRKESELIEKNVRELVERLTTVESTITVLESIQQDISDLQRDLGLLTQRVEALENV